MVPMNRRHFFYIILSLSLLLFFSSQPAFAQNPKVDLATALKFADSKKLWEHKEWLRLGIYKPQIFGGFESFVEAGLFFISKDGKHNPKEELLETIKGFYSTAISDDKNPNPQCKFPARLSWVQKQIGTLDIPKIECQYLKMYREKIKSQSVSVVFSSYYMNNPGSTFGHTFLRFNKLRQEESRKGSGRNELLDMAFSYGANIPPNAPSYAMLGGLIGLLPGSLSTLPYYFKVREYNDFEDRDLWSYELNLTEKEVHQLTNFLWELSSAYIDYYFFDDNCAYIILAAIETAAPHLNITKRLRPWIIPADTIKVVARYPGLVRNIQYRPSIRRQLLTRINSLDKDSKPIFNALVNDKGKNSIEPFLEEVKDDNSKAKILDTLADNISFLHPEDVKSQKSTSYMWKNKVLIARSSIPIISEPLVIKPRKIEQPDLGHESMRAGLLIGENEFETVYQGELRFAIHDSLDGELGFPRNSQVEFFNIKGRYSDSLGLDLLDWALVRVASYTPQDFIKTTKSFRMETGIRRIFDKNCSDDECIGGYFEAGLGYSIKPFQKGSLVTYAFLDFEMMYSQELLKNTFRIGAGPRAGIIYNAASNLKLHLNSFYHYFPWAAHESYNETQLRARWTLNTHLALDLSASHRYNYGSEALLGVYVYF